VIMLNGVNTWGLVVPPILPLYTCWRWQCKSYSVIGQACIYLRCFGVAYRGRAKTPESHGAILVRRIYE